MRGANTPVQFAWSQSIAAGATFNPLTTWDYETPDVDGEIEVLDKATAVGLVRAVKSAGDTIRQEDNVQAGGTAGVTPSVLNTTPIVGRVGKFKKLSIPYRNPTGGAITVDGVITFVPRGGRRR